MKKHSINILLAALAISFTSCISEDQLTAERPLTDDGEIINAGSTIDAVLPTRSNQLTVNVTVRPAGDVTKAGIDEYADTASVQVVSYHKGENPFMSDSVSGADIDNQGTKAIYNNNSSRLLDANFLRLDEIINEEGAATYEWPNWGRAKLLEAEVISTPDIRDDMYYRSVTFTPVQAYNIRTYNDDADTLFYHSRLICWHPMILSVPRDGDKAAAVEFSNSRYASNRYNVTADEFGVVFDHSLDGSVDLMMSNMAEGQRWHRKFNPEQPESSEHDTYNRRHYADKAQTQEEVVYSLPFGHYSRPGIEYANTVVNHHYLTAVRLWAIVENSGESTNMNLKTWGEIRNVSFVDQPSTAIIALPKETSSPFNMDQYGHLEKNPDGSYAIYRQRLVFGEVVSWADETNLDIHSDRMFGDDVSNADHDYTVEYPVDMTKDGGVRLNKTYLGYCLVKPFELYELSETDGIDLAIQTSAGIYYATIPSIAKYDDGAGHVTKENMFQSGQIYDVILNLRTEGSINEFIEKENDVNYINLSPYDTQNQNFMSANCYVIDKTELKTRIDNAATEGPAGYCFTGSIMGNGTRGVVTDGSVSFPTSDAVIRGGTSARIVWQSERNLITNVQLQHEYVRFIVNAAHEGNAVLAVTDANGDILWSWHIWITEDPTKNPLEVTINSSGDKVKMLDRNLGALSNNPGTDDAALFSTFGLYYQWGRKDPLPGPAEKNTFSSIITPVYDGFSEETRNIYANSFGSGIESSIKYPMNYLYCDDSPYYQYNWMQRPIDFLWGLNTGGKIQKSIYDPCPFGYRVPQEEIQNFFENAKNISQTDGKGVTVTSSEDVDVFFPYAGFIGSERGQYSREPEFNYVSTKGDYTSGAICPTATVSLYSYFSNHRLRTYIAKESWNEENIDGEQLFNFTVLDGKYRVYYDGTKQRDYTNRTSAATVRCVQDKSYEGKGYANLTKPQNYSSKDVIPGAILPLIIKGGLNIGVVNASLTIQPLSGTDPKGAPTVVDLVNGTDPNFHIEKRTATTIEGTYNYTYPSDFIDRSITSFRFTLNVSDREDPSLTVKPSFQTVSFNFAKLLIQDNSATPPSSGRPFLTVDSGRNFTKTNEPLVGQPAYFTVYARKDFADKYKTLYGGVDPVVTGYVSNTDNSGSVNLSFNKQSSPVTIGGIQYYEFRSGSYTNDFTGAAGGTKKCKITLSLSNGASDGSVDTDEKTIKIWGIVTDDSELGDRVIRKGLLIIRTSNYYLRASNNSTLTYFSTENIYDYSSLFHNSKGFDWKWGTTTPQGQTEVKSVKYSTPGGTQRYWYVSDKKRGSGSTVVLNTEKSDIYWLDVNRRTIYVNNESQLGTWLYRTSDGTGFKQTRDKTYGPITNTTNGYHYTYFVYNVKDPTAENSQSLPFVGSPSGGDFDSNYVIL